MFKAITFPKAIKAKLPCNKYKPIINESHNTIKLTDFNDISKTELKPYLDVNAKFLHAKLDIINENILKLGTLLMNQHKQ